MSATGVFVSETTAACEMKKGKLIK